MTKYEKCAIIGKDMTEPETWKVYTPDEVAKILKVTRRTIYRWIKSKVLEAIKIDGVYRIPEDSINKVLRGGTR